MRETVQLMQQEVSGQDEKVKLVIIGKGKFLGGDYLCFLQKVGIQNTVMKRIMNQWHH